MTAGRSLRDVVISGTGHEVGSRAVENVALEAFIETTDAFIRERTGLLERRYVEPHEAASTLMVPAGKAAMAAAGVGPDEIDLLIVNTLSPDFHDPAQACLIQPMLGLGPVPSFDIRAQCSGGLYGLEIARGLVGSGTYGRALVVCGEVLSKRMGPSREGRNLSILLSDGAGAMVVEPAAPGGPRLVDLEIGADGTRFDLLKTAAPGSAGDRFLAEDDVAASRHQFRMNGPGTFEDAVRRITEVSRSILARNGLSLDDVDLVVPHQPNLRILEAVMTELRVPKEKMFVTVERFGNMASAAFPVALSEARATGALGEDDLALFVTYGSGATWGAALHGTRPA